MANTNGTIGLEALVKKILFKLDEPEEQYFRYLQFTMDGLRQMNMHHNQLMRYAKFTLDDLNSLDYPDDYIGFIAIGVPYNGRLWTFTEDKMLVVTVTDDGGTDTFDSDLGEGDAVSESLWGSYGAGGGTNANYYVRDDVARKIYVNGTVQTQVILYYVSSGINLSGTDTLVPFKLADAIEKYVIWQMASYNTFGSNKNKARVSDLQMMEDQYYTSLRQAREFDSWTADTLIDAIRSTYTQTPSR